MSDKAVLLHEVLEADGLLGGGEIVGDVVIEPVPCALEAIDDAVPNHRTGVALAHGAFDLAPAGVELLPALARAFGQCFPAFAADDPP